MIAATTGSKYAKGQKEDKRDALQRAKTGLGGAADPLLCAVWDFYTELLCLKAAAYTAGPVLSEIGSNVFETPGSEVYNGLVTGTAMAPLPGRSHLAPVFVAGYRNCDGA